MIHRDYLLKAVDGEKQIRITIASTTGLVNVAHQRHNTSATASAALGRVLTAALMIGSDLKNDEDMVTLRINGDGPAGSIIASVDSQGNGRAMMSHPEADLPSQSPGKLDVGGLVGHNGYLEVIKDLGMKQPFSGRVDLVSGEIGVDIAEYFLKSEQVPSLVSLGVLVDTDLSIKAAGGLIIQALPGADDSILARVEENVLNAGAVSSLISRHESLEEVLDLIMKEIPYQVVGEIPLAFRCRCSHERLAAVVASFPPQEMEELFDDGGRMEVVCNFCGENYHYTREEIEARKDKKPLI